MLIQQGDTLYFKMKKLPQGLEKKPFDGIVQHGEATGHAHRIKDFQELAERKEAVYLTDAKTGKRYLRLFRPIEIVHEEHKPVKLDPGEYEIGIVREYDHFKEESRAVLD